MDPEVFERVLEVDLLGVYRTVHAALPHVVERRGQLVLVASVAAFVNGMLLAPYGMAKAGVEQLGRALRTELARHGASASVAYFGFIDTEMVRQGYEQDPLAVRAEAQVPRLIRRRLAPSKAAAAIVRGLERRAPRIIAPRYWTAASLLRGLINPPFDRASERRAQIQALIAEADVEDRFAGPKLTVPAGRERT
jgi:NAD(P)-dependent dehydrogenase (short-subunit alcohol dehydrogenase family)